MKQRPDSGPCELGRPLPLSVAAAVGPQLRSTSLVQGGAGRGGVMFRFRYKRCEKMGIRQDEEAAAADDSNRKLE